MRYRNAIKVSVLSGMIAAPVYATSEVIKDWTLECASEHSCYVSQALTSPEDRFLAHVRLHPTTSGAAAIEIAVPEGTHLPSGIFVATGQRQPHRLEWQRCDRGLCVAMSEMSRGELATWKRMNTAAVRYRPAMDQEVVAFRVSLMGLTEALRRAGRGAQ